MRRSIAPALWAVVLAAGGSAWACSNDDKSAAPGSGGASAGSKAHAGSAATAGGESAGGAPADGGTASGDGGRATHGGAGSEPSGGVAAEGGAAALPAGGTGGGDGAGGSGSDPPDLVIATGGPWPDSLTGACSNTSKDVACPQMGEAFFGQDGTYRLNVPSYAKTATSLKDSVTGLAWQLTPDPAGKTQAAAAKYCDDLELGGQTDWRLPTRLEYVSVLDLGMGSGYAMPPDILLETTRAHWTASATGSGAGQFFMINDQFGAWTVAVDSTPLGARCVRGPTLGGSLTVETDVVSDSMTQLVWQVTGLSPAARTWQQALEDCESSSYAGQSDWRLPSIKELATIVDEAAVAVPAIRAELGGDVAASYWSSTPAPSFGPERFAFALETSLGVSPSSKMTESAAAVRCVRSQP
jgi:hypothetical protein